MRLSEAAGLHINDIILDEDIPYINLIPSSLEKLKDQRQSEADTIGRCITMGSSEGKDQSPITPLPSKIQHHYIH